MLAARYRSGLSEAMRATSALDSCYLIVGEGEGEFVVADCVCREAGTKGQALRSLDTVTRKMQFARDATEDEEMKGRLVTTN
jgi:hypothetical protein